MDQRDGNVFVSRGASLVTRLVPSQSMHPSLTLVSPSSGHVRLPARMRFHVFPSSYNDAGRRRRRRSQGP